MEASKQDALCFKIIETIKYADSLVVLVKKEETARCAQLAGRKTKKLSNGNQYQE